MKKKKPPAKKPRQWLRALSAEQADELFAGVGQMGSPTALRKLCLRVMRFVAIGELDHRVGNALVHTATEMRRGLDLSKDVKKLRNLAARCNAFLKARERPAQGEWVEERRGGGNEAAAE